MTTKTDLLGSYWCHECKKWGAVKRTSEGLFQCAECWEHIRCDECGDEWTDDHRCSRRCTSCGEREEETAIGELGLCITCFAGDPPDRAGDR